MFRSSTACAALALVLLAGCATSNPDVISRDAAMRAQTLVDATVLSVRAVVIDGNQSGLGAAVGAVAGGIAGSTVGGKREAIVAGALGAIAAGALGNAIERSVTREAAVELVVQKRNGERLVLVQAQGTQDLRPGDSVVLISDGRGTRVVRAR